MRNFRFLLTFFFLSAPVVFGQAKVAVVDFERAVVESAAGKKSSAQFNAKLQEKQKDGEKRQKDMEDLQNKLKTQDRALSESAKLDLQRDIERRQRELTRFSEDSQKELEALRNDLLRPIAEKATLMLNMIVAEQAYTIVIDTSNPQTNVVWANPKNDITAELIRRIDADSPKPEQPRKP